MGTDFTAEAETLILDTIADGPTNLFNSTARLLALIERARAEARVEALEEAASAADWLTPPESWVGDIPKENLFIASMEDMAKAIRALKETAK